MSSCVIAYVPLQVAFADCGHSPVKRGHRTRRRATKILVVKGPPDVHPRHGDKDVGPEECTDAVKQYRRKSRVYLDKYFTLKLPLSANL